MSFNSFKRGGEGLGGIRRGCGEVGGGGGAQVKSRSKPSQF